MSKVDLAGWSGEAAAGRIDQIVYGHAAYSDYRDRGFIASSVDHPILSNLDSLLRPFVATGDGYEHPSLCYFVHDELAFLIYRVMGRSFPRPAPFSHVLVGNREMLSAELALALWQWRWPGARPRGGGVGERLEPIDAVDLIRTASTKWPELEYRALTRHRPEMISLIAQLFPGPDLARSNFVATESPDNELPVLLLAGLVSLFGSEFLSSGFSTHEHIEKAFRYPLGIIFVDPPAHPVPFAFAAHVIDIRQPSQVSAEDAYWAVEGIARAYSRWPFTGERTVVVLERVARWLREPGFVPPVPAVGAPPRPDDADAQPSLAESSSQDAERSVTETPPWPPPEQDAAGTQPGPTALPPQDADTAEKQAPFRTPSEPDDWPGNVVAPAPDEPAHQTGLSEPGHAVLPLLDEGEAPEAPQQHRLPRGFSRLLSLAGGASRRDFHPRIEAPDQVVAGQQFTLTVGVAPVAVPGVSGRMFSLPRKSLTLGVQVVADGFRLVDGYSWRNELRVTSTQPFPCVTLQMEAMAQGPRVRAAQIQAVYDTGGAVIGLGARAIAVVDSPSLLPRFSMPHRDQPVVLSPRAAGPAADLTVTITCGESPGRLCWSYLSPYFTSAAEPETCDVGPDGAREYARTLIRQVHRHTGRADIAQFLRGTGGQISDKVPDGLWVALAEVAAQTSPRQPTLLLLSEEPYIPWELALLPTPLDPALPAYLGCQVTVGRWVLAKRKPGLPPPSVGEADTMSVVAGIYNLPSWPRLWHAEEEAQLLAETYHARLVPADLPSVLALLADDPLADMVHFAVHGSADPSEQEKGIILVDGKGLEPTVVRACSLRGMPFVFLNACQLGTGEEVLGDYAGMAHAFLYAGACGVTAPLWSVNDYAAKTLALTFYARVVAGERPADVLRDLRCGTSANPRISASALAYQFFGHPCMTLRPVSGSPARNAVEAR